MELQVGSILEGKVTSITKFGAFVALEGGKSGLVHISEIANTFVNDVHEFLQEGQEVKVMVLSAENGKINLSGGNGTGGEADVLFLLVVSECKNKNKFDLKVK